MRQTAVITGFLLLTAARIARADVCVVIDEARDTFSARDRAAATVLVAKEFEREGVRVAQDGCETVYTISHVSLGSNIFVTLSGPEGQRDGTARGTDDLPALYSQMVRSMVTGRPMTGFNVIDRTNVTKTQSSVRRVQTDAFTYARVGYGGVFGGKRYGGPTIGFGHRVELDSLAIDISFFNYQIQPASYAGGEYYSSSGGVAGSLVKLEGLHFVNPTANASTYLGGGISWAMRESSNTSATTSTSSHGSGLQGELTIGYEVARASALRIFVQADAGLPFFKMQEQSFAMFGAGRASAPKSRYAPSLGISLGLGWQRHRP